MGGGGRSAGVSLSSEERDRDILANTNITNRNKAIRTAKAKDALITRRDTSGNILKSSFAKEGTLNDVAVIDPIAMLEEGYSDKVLIHGNRVGTEDIQTVAKGDTTQKAPEKKKEVARRKTKGAKNMTKETRKKRQSARKRNIKRTKKTSSVQLKSKGDK